MTTFLQDVRFAIRGLVRRPGFALISLLTLALGIGANTAVFSVVQAVLLRPLPFAEPERLLRVAGFDLATGERSNLSPADFLDFQSESQTLERMGAHSWIGPATVSDGQGGAERLGRVEVTEGFLPTLGVQPALGRHFTIDEDTPGAAPVAILSDGLWRSMFGSDPEIIGRTVLVNAVPTTVVGVLPASFRHVEERTDRDPGMFTPYRFDTANPNRGGHFIRGVGRLGSGATEETAAAELATIATRLEQEYPQSNRDQGVAVGSLHDDVVGESRSTLLILLGAAALVLLIACANLGNLLLAVGASREREMAVRAALGAGRSRLIRQLLTECLVLGALGGGAGLMIATAMTGTLTRLSGAGIPRAGDIQVDLAVLGFATLIAVLATAAFGLIPALTMASGEVGSGLRQGGRQGVETVASRSRSALISAEVALSVVLMVGAGLLVGTLLNLRGVPTGFEPEQAISMEVAPPLARYPEGTQIPLHREFGERVRAVPGVTAAGATNILPLTANFDSRGFLIDDQPLPEPGAAPSVQARSVTDGYFGAMGVPLLRGRTFDERDHLESPLVVIISQSMADRYWPGQDPVGRRITYSAGVDDSLIRAACPDVDPFQCIGGPASREIIGIVGDVKHLDLREAEAIPMFYTPNTQQPSYHSMTWIVRAQGDPVTVTAEIRTALAAIDPEIPLAQLRTLDDVLSQAVAVPTVRAGLVGMFAVLAVLLAWVGVYGVVGYLVTRRTHEIGIRVALGASAHQLLRMLALDGLRPVLIGIAIGVPIALATSRLLGSLLYGVSPLHPAVYLVACATLGVVGMLATLLPARRALRVDPAVALEQGR